MKNFKYSLMLILCCFVANNALFSQRFGEELITEGTFGTTSDPNNINTTKNIYPAINGIQNGTINPYYQPAKKVYHNGNFIDLEINPGVTIGTPLKEMGQYPDDYQTAYIWGFTEPWETTAYNFPTNSDPQTDSGEHIPHAPNNGNYLIVTSTKGMYALPSLTQISWHEIYDRYETNTLNPTNFFLIINADPVADKIFYRQTVAVKPGQLYRMSVDLAQLNLPSAGTNPNVNFFIEPDADVSSETKTYNTGKLNPDGSWNNYYFDYIAPCNDDSYNVRVAFRNQAEGGNGNDLALDNLSMRPIYPQLKSTITQNEEDCTATLELDGSIEGALNPDNFHFQWQVQEVNGDYSFIDDATSPQYATKTPGTYRVAIYTDATVGCPMYSDGIRLELSGNNCLKATQPDAQPDIYLAYSDILLKANVLDNDNTSSSAISHDDLSVLNYTINGVYYPAGTSASIITGGNTVGSITINANGDFLFITVPGYFGAIPVITYTITEPGGDQSSSTLTINIPSFTVIVGDFCALCPVDIAIESDLFNTSESYTIYDADDLNTPLQTASLGNDDLVHFDFKQPNKSGIITYSLWRSTGSPTEELLRFSLLVAPKNATWAPNTLIQSTEWNNRYNWMSESGMGFPYWCTDVVIPADAAYYPIIKNENTEKCRDITFENNASVGQIHKLNYRRANVEYTPDRDKWVMLSAPLKYIYSADFQADPSWDNGAGGSAIDPKIYMRYFDIGYLKEQLKNPDDSLGYSIGGFSRTFSNLKEKFDPAQGFVLNIGESKNNYFSGTYRFPRLLNDGSEVTYMYHYTDTGEWITDDRLGEKHKPFTLERGVAAMDSATWVSNNINDNSFSLRGEDSRYRFIYEESNAINNNYVINVANAGTTNIVGNPYMSHLDFNALYTDNASNIQAYYRVFDGTTFYSYMNTGTKENDVWEGFDGISTGDTEQGNRLILPMQSFFVEMMPGSSTLTFKPDNISTVPAYVPPASENPEEGTRRANKVSTASNLLKLHLSMGNKTNTTILAVLPKASDLYKPEEDVYKLFADESSIRNIQNENYYPVEIYTVSDGYAIDINAISNEGKEKIVPVGIKTLQTGQATITVEGVDNFSAYPFISLIDTQLDKVYDLNRDATINFEKTDEDLVEGRFYIIMSQEESATTSNAEINQYINVFTQNGQITISTLKSHITGIEIYDISGRLNFKKEGLCSTYESFYPNLIHGIYVMRVKTVNGNSEFKINL